MFRHENAVLARGVVGGCASTGGKGSQKRKGTLESMATAGKACKYPGAAVLDAFWQLLVGGNAVTYGIPGVVISRQSPYHCWPGL